MRPFNAVDFLHAGTDVLRFTIGPPNENLHPNGLPEDRESPPKDEPQRRRAFRSGIKRFDFPGIEILLCRFIALIPEGFEHYLSTRLPSFPCAEIILVTFETFL